MNGDHIIYLVALPTLLVFVLVEYIYRKRSSRYKKLSLNIIASNLFLGLLDRLFFVFFSVLHYEAMKWLQEYSFFNLKWHHVLSTIALFTLVDFIWYYYHRIVHQKPILWALHSTHHQTGEYSLTLGFRLSFITQILRAICWMPLIIIGFEPIHILSVVFFQHFYQFFIHTEIWTFPKWTRSILVTPQSHKLHHSNAKEHLNANYGGVLILWDKLFNTYKNPYNKVIKLEGSLSHEKFTHPLNGLFLPLINFFRVKVGKNLSKGLQLNESLSNNYRLMNLFLVFFIPAIAFILFGGQIKIAWLIVLSFGLIIMILSTLYFSFKK